MSVAQPHPAFRQDADEEPEPVEQGVGQSIKNFFKTLRQNLGHYKAAWVNGDAGKGAPSETLGAIIASIVVALFVQLVRILRGREPFKIFGGPKREGSIIPEPLAGSAG